MVPQQSTYWYHDVRQQVLLDYSKLKKSSPDGMYISIKPGDPLQWQGILFVRKGPYSPAILRFQVSFPIDYPSLPPVINFVSDIFHPLVTPLTTYTYTTGSVGSETVSATDEGRLPPGGFSLGYAFPQWVARGSGRTSSLLPSPQTDSKRASTITAQTGENATAPSDDGDVRKNSSPESASPNPLHSSRRLLSEYFAQPQTNSILDVLLYVKQVFSEESALDHLPLEAAGNTGAWKAWRAYRASKGAAVVDRRSTSGREKHDEWNWDGVWEQRVRRGIEASVSESVLYGNAPGSSDMIRFSNLDRDTIDEVRAHMLGSLSDTHV